MHPIHRRCSFPAVCCVMVLLSSVVMTSSIAAAQDRPDVLFVAIDDLNDWVGCLGGHPQAKTPHIDRLAARGMLFTNAHCNASLCNPSRASVMTGTLPSTNGVHGNQQDWRQSPYLEGRKTLPQIFREQGYWTGACGKIYHANHGAECGALNGGHGGLRGFNHPASWTARFPAHTQQLPKLAVPTGRNFNGLDIWHWDWGPIDVPVGATEDGQAAEWAAQMLRKQPKDQPLFLALGLYAPHGPWYCPPAYFDEHPLADVQLPPLNPEDDLDDIPQSAKGFLRNPHHHHAEILRSDLYDDAVQAYLAQITFADAMLGRVLDALDERGADDTVIVLWSDHGWHLGEKQKWHKGTNWEEGTRVPLIIVAPGITQPGSTCGEPVSLVDLYPTLLDLCGLPTIDGLDGHSLKPQLLDPAAPTASPAYTINAGRDQSVRSKRWRYIRYGDGSEELYDHDADPTEYTNLAGDPQYDPIKRELAAAFPDEIRRADETHAVRFGPDGEPTDIPDEPGFRPIFNGYDLTTWVGDPQLWRVENGAIVGETTRDNHLEANTFLVWRGSQPANFELRLRFRITGDNNSGVQYRSKPLPERGEWAIGGYQADLHPAVDLLGMVYEEQGRGIIARRGQQVVVTPQGRKMLAGKFDRVVTDDRQPFDLSSGWRELQIVADANHLVHKVDGKTVAEVWDHEAPARSQRGLIALQLHRGSQMRAEFRDLRMRDLPPRPMFAPDHGPLPQDAPEVNSRRRP